MSKLSKNWVKSQNFGVFTDKICQIFGFKGQMLVLRSTMLSFPVKINCPSYYIQYDRMHNSVHCISSIVNGTGAGDVLQIDARSDKSVRQSAFQSHCSQRVLSGGRSHRGNSNG